MRIRILLAGVMVASGIVAASQSPAAAHLTGCAHNAQQPHLSSTAGLGIDAKSSMNCNHRHDSGEINVALYKCDRGHGDTIPSENWIFDNCDLVSLTFNHITPLAANTKYVRQTPGPGSGDEVHGSGWYVNDTVFVTHNNGNTDSIGEDSRVVYITE